MSKYYLCLVLLTVIVFGGSCKGNSDDGNIGNDQKPEEVILPKIEEFSALPLTIRYGESSTIAWKASGVTNVTITPFIGVKSISGSENVKLFYNTEFTITASNKFGRDSRSLEVIVNYNPDFIVYITNTGTKYHMDGCRYLSQSKIPMKLSKACKAYSPCSVCLPPVCK